MTRPQDRRRRTERDLLQKAADKARSDASRGQAESKVRRAPIVPYDRFSFVGLLDELALAAGRGDLPDGVRRTAVELAEKLLAEDEEKPDRAPWP